MPFPTVFSRKLLTHHYAISTVSPVRVSLPLLGLPGPWPCLWTVLLHFGCAHHSLTSGTRDGITSLWSLLPNTASGTRQLWNEWYVLLRLPDGEDGASPQSAREMGCQSSGNPRSAHGKALWEKTTEHLMALKRRPENSSGVRDSLGSWGTRKEKSQLDFKPQLRSGQVAWHN